MAKRDCPGCREPRRRVAELEALVRDLQARLGQNASNSSVPPSANPPAAPKPVAEEPIARKPGGQPGRAACQRVRLGQLLLGLADDVFHWWHRVRDGTMQRPTLRTYIDSQ